MRPPSHPPKPIAVFGQGETWHASAQEQLSLRFEALRRTRRDIKHANGMRDRPGLLLAAAERLTVDLVAQTPVAIRLRADTLAYARHVAEAEGFDVLPVLEEDGRIIRYICKSALDVCESEEEWRGVELVEIHADDLVSASTPLLDLVSRFSRTRPRLFVLGRRQVDGIVTVYDLNQPAAHQFGFALSLVVEAELGRAIEVAARKSADELDTEVDGRIGDRVAGLPRGRYGGAARRADAWRTKVENGEQVRLTQELVFNDKIGLVESMGIADTLALRCVPPYNADGPTLVRYLREEVKELRNAVAHDRQELADEWAMWRWLRTTLELAQSLVEG
jgi:predicted transcriptional regulator